MRKKYWYIAIAVAIVVVLLVAGGVYLNYQSNHPDSSYDAIPRELREEMMEHWPEEELGEPLFRNKNLKYYGTHGDCVVFFCSGRQNLIVSDMPVVWEIAGSRFGYPKGFWIIVYHDGKFAELTDAYYKYHWLNRWQIKSIAQYHRQEVIDQYGEYFYD